MGLTKIIRCRMFCVMCILSAVVVTFVYVGGINQSDSTGEGGRRTTHRTGDPCDGECHRFRRLLAQWPNEKPKAAIVYLLHAPRLKVAIQGISTVDKFFGRQFDYPIIVFHEAGLNATRRDQVRKAVTWNKERVFFQKVEFKVPTFLKKPVPLKLPAPCQKPIGYRHMCRFHAKGVYEQPVMLGLDYMWRLDDDSRLLSPVNYDVFRFMRDRHLDYGYVWRHLDASMCVTGLWGATRDFLHNASFHPQFFDEWREPFMFYNNFEISRISIWLSADYRRYIDYIDRQGGIYYHRWGDAPIKGIAVALFVPKERTHFFLDIGYRHQGLENGVTNRRHVDMYRKSPNISVIL